MQRPSRLTPTTGKRLDIQGLRAVAVLAVLFNHAFGFPRGGFVGVDVFFVISGFLITTHLLGEVRRSGRVDLLAFAGRRIRRLAPVAVTVIATTMAVAVAVFAPGRVENVSTDAVWSLAAAANFRFITVGTDYFQADGPTSPFQHFWSLAVEEQFYLVLPVVMLVLALVTRPLRRRRAFTIAFAVLVSVVVLSSFLLALVLTGDQPTVAYFSTATRAWELGIGSALALVLTRVTPLPEVWGQVLAHLGLVVIVASVFLIDEGRGFPAPWALVPVLGTALVTLGGTTVRRRHSVILTNRLSTYLGDISYSLYLWHFPTIIVIEQIAPGAVALAVPFSIALAVSSFHLIERPLLSAPWSGGFRGAADDTWAGWLASERADIRRGGFLALSTAALLLISMATVTTKPLETVPGADLAGDFSLGQVDGTSAAEPVDDNGPALAGLQEEVRQAIGATSWPTLSPPIEDYLDGSIPEGPRQRCIQKAEDMPKTGCVFGNVDGAHTAVLIGDSTAAYEIDALAPLFEEPGSTWKLEVRSAVACTFMDYHVTQPCTEYREQTMLGVENTHPDLAIITSTYGQLPDGDDRFLSAADIEKRLTPYVERVAASAGEVVLLAPPPISSKDGAVNCYQPGQSPVSCLSSINSDWRQRAEMEQTLAEAIDGVWIDSSAAVCSDGRCPLFIGDHLVLNDKVHYTAAFAARLAPVYEEMLRAAGAFDEPEDRTTAAG